MTKELVQFWKGDEESYKKLYVRGRIKDNVRYTVKMNDGTVREYLGNDILDNSDLEQLAAVDDVISIDRFQEGFNKKEYSNCRLLVGDNNAFDADGKIKTDYTPASSEETLWYIMVFKEDKAKPSNIIDFNGKTVRIKSMGMREFMLVDNMLTTYDAIVWHEPSK